MGCLPALACALAFGRRLPHCYKYSAQFVSPNELTAFSHSDGMPLPALLRVLLFSPASMFWPIWLRPPMLPEDWWTHAPPTAAKITSYVIRDDPLSDGVPGANGFRAPQMPGRTIVLPPKYTGADLWKNHNLENFL